MLKTVVTESILRFNLANLKALVEKSLKVETLRNNNHQKKKDKENATSTRILIVVKFSKMVITAMAAIRKLDRTIVVSLLKYYR